MVTTGNRWNAATDIRGLHRVAGTVAALVTVDDGPRTPTVVLLDAVWCWPEEARGHIERRMPELHVEHSLAGRRVRAVVCPARLEVTVERALSNDALTLREARHRSPERGQLASLRDGKVIDWMGR